jgi:hypothetical protein
VATCAWISVRALTLVLYLHPAERELSCRVSCITIRNSCSPCIFDLSYWRPELPWSQRLPYRDYLSCRALHTSSPYSGIVPS